MLSLMLQLFTKENIISNKIAEYTRLDLISEASAVL